MTQESEEPKSAIDDVKGTRVVYLLQPDAYYHADEFKRRTPSHVVHSLDPKALAEMQHVAELAIDDASSQGLGIASQAREVLRAFGLTPPGPTT